MPIEKINDRKENVSVKLNNTFQTLKDQKKRRDLQLPKQRNNWSLTDREERIILDEKQ